MIEQYLFYMFAFLIITSSSMVINSKNPIHSVLFLILAYVNASGLFLLLGVEFLALIFLIVYVGAVAILFIFTVMMLNLTSVTRTLRESLVGLAPISGVIGLIFFIQVHTVLSKYKGIELGLEIARVGGTPSGINVDWTSIHSKLSELNLIGESLYVNYGYLIIVASLVLLIAMIGAIILTLDHNKNIRRQDINNQITRHSFAPSVERGPKGPFQVEREKSRLGALIHPHTESLSVNSRI